MGAVPFITANLPVEGPGSVEIGLAYRVAGVIIPGRDPGRALNAETIKALFPLIEMGRQQLELARALAEAGASRSRLLLAANEERRRLERDLHDGAQQRWWLWAWVCDSSNTTCRPQR